MSPCIGGPLGLSIACCGLPARHAQFREVSARGVGQPVEFGEPRLLSGDGLIELCLSEHHLILQPSPARKRV